MHRPSQSSELEPPPAPYEPLEQFWHDVDPAVSVYVPGAHAVQLSGFHPSVVKE